MTDPGREPHSERQRSRAMAEAADRGWVKAIGRKLRDDLGDAPTLPKEMLDLLDQMQQATPAMPDGKGARDRREK